MLTPKKEPSATMRLYAEDEAGSTVALLTRRHRNYGQRFFTMFELNSEGLANFERPAAYWRCLLFLLSRLDPVQFRRISAKEMASEIGISSSSAERALAMLEADQVILSKGTTAAKARRLNNRICWKANSDRFHEATPDPAPEDARGRA